ncbi:hypothetical protein IGJ53_001047 [Enterococcus sp. DIV1283b]|nr:ImmA/IrrE family metallo-endopeptidase [Enterococcus faecium]MCS8591632.1 ImmA/IrrE family metallo-endopeptidase [Enterococcus faecium]
MDKVEKFMSKFPNLEYKFEKYMPEKQKGLYIDNVIYLNPEQSIQEMASTITEEIGHHLSSVGDIVDQDTNEKRKQEQKARDIGFTLLVTPQDFIDCYNERFTFMWESAEFLGITTEALKNAVRTYSKIYPDGLAYKNYKILFKSNGTVGVFEWFD